jgi:plastocyanin
MRLPECEGDTPKGRTYVTTIVMHTARTPGVLTLARSVACLVFAVACLYGQPRTIARAEVTPVTVTLDLGRYANIERLPAGPYAGVSPGRVVVHVGEAVVFINSDTRHHTATSLVDATRFPQDPRWTDSALRASGSIGNGMWSSGDLAPGARSAPIAATRAGTYLYGCFFDYSAGVRGEIVVEP